MSRKKETRLLAIDHYVYGGELIAERQLSGKPLRILIAGGGTGRETVFWGKDLKKYDLTGSIIHLDFSLPSIRIAQAWISSFELEDVVTFEHSTIEAFAARHAAEAMPLFDIISCTGVLHHLDDPDLGLKLLQQMLTPDGGMDVMVYGVHGRAGLYEVQEALRYALPPNELLTDSERVQETRILLHHTGIPKTSICLFPTCMPGPNTSDAEILDRMLHRQDRAYSVRQFYEFVQGANLRIDTLYPEATYDPDYTVFHGVSKDAYMVRRMKNRPRHEQFHFTELMTSRPDRHYAYLSQMDSSIATDRRQHRRQDPKWRHVMAPVLTSFLFADVAQDALSLWKTNAITRSLHVPTVSVNWPGKAEATVPVPSLSFAFEDAAANGNSTAEEIIQGVVVLAAGWARDASATPLSYKEVAKAFFEWLDKYESTGELYCVRAR